MSTIGRTSFRLAAAAAALVWCGSAVAQIDGCLDDSSVWNTPYPQGTVQSISYYHNDLVLGVYGRSGSIDLYVNVPVGIAQASFGLTTADSFVAARVHGHFSEALLAEVTACPLLNETTGAFLLAE
jgi:hypothetical protein